MNRPLLAFAGLLVAGGTAVGVYVAAPGGGEEEVVQQAATTMSPVSPEPTPSTSSTPTPLVTFGPTPTPMPVPADWGTYDPPSSLFSIRYPPGWHESGGGFVSKDPMGKQGPLSDAIGVEISTQLDDGYGCGVLQYDLATGLISPEKGAEPITLGGIPAWHITRGPGDPLLNDPYTRIEAVSVTHNGYCFNVAAYFTQRVPDASVVGEIVSTFLFTM